MLKEKKKHYNFGPNFNVLKELMFKVMFDNLFLFKVGVIIIVAIYRKYICKKFTTMILSIKNEREIFNSHS